MIRKDYFACMAVVIISFGEQAMEMGGATLGSLESSVGMWISGVDIQT